MTGYFFNSGSQRVVVGDPQNRVNHKFSTCILLKSYKNTVFGDPKVDRDQPIENHWCRKINIKMNDYLINQWLNKGNEDESVMKLDWDKKKLNRKKAIGFPGKSSTEKIH